MSGFHERQLQGQVVGGVRLLFSEDFPVYGRGDGPYPDWATEDFWLYEEYSELKRLGWSFRDACAEAARQRGVPVARVRGVCNAVRKRRKAAKR